MWVGKGSCFDDCDQWFLSVLVVDLTASCLNLFIPAIGLGLGLGLGLIHPSSLK